MVGCWCKNPSSHFHCASRFTHPRTRTHVRLLGPCFKTGRREPFCHQAVQARVHPGTFDRPEASFHVPEVFPEAEPKLTRKARGTVHVLLKTCCPACAEATSNRIGTRQSRHAGWFHSLPFQQFQALLTLFSKSFSSFPHGTCLLSFSNRYSALDEIYHPLCAPILRNVTLRKHAVHGGLQMTCGTLTLIGALFQEAYICASDGSTSRDYNSRPEAPISMLSWSLFIRHYWGNPG